jgi:hypothetical protein
MTALNLAESPSLHLSAQAVSRTSALHQPPLSAAIPACRCVSPGVVGMVFAVTAHVWVGLGVWPEFRDWFTTDALGTAVATPAFVHFQNPIQGDYRDGRTWRTASSHPSSAAVSADAGSAIAIIFPLIVLIQLRLGLGWLRWRLSLWRSRQLYREQVGGTSGLHPIGIETSICVCRSLWRRHVHDYSISVVVENLRSTERKLRETVYLHELVTRAREMSSFWPT